MKKLVLICLALVIALGGLGVAYAMWSDTVTINTTVQTGSVNVELVSQKSNDPGPHGTATGGGWFTGSLDPAGGHQYMGDGYWSGIGNPLDPTGWTWVGTRYAKNVASANCDFTADTLTFTIDNGYPCYGPDVAFGVQNKGTIPVKILSIKLTSVTTPNGTFAKNIDVDNNFNQTAYMVANDGTVTPYTNAGQFPAGWDDAAAFSFNITSLGAQPLLHTQIEPAGSLWGDVGVHVAQSAVETSRYSFTVVFTYAQWNEVP